jgi:hypothetical protein
MPSKLSDFRRLDTLKNVYVAKSIARSGIMQS